MDKGAVVGAIVLGALTVFGYARMFLSGRGSVKLKEILPKAVVVDVRTNAEYKEGHYSGAINLPVEKIAKSSRKLGNTDKPIILYCASGSRAGKAARILRRQGFQQVYNGINMTTLDSLK